MDGRICTFFGHGECFGLDTEVLRNAIEGLIFQGVDDFMVGHQGQYDSMVRSCLQTLQVQYPHIRYSMVLAYLPTRKTGREDYLNTIYPEGIEKVPAKYAIDWRNRYLINRADICVCYVNHPWGGVYKFARMAKRRGLTVINLGKMEL